MAVYLKNSAFTLTSHIGTTNFEKSSNFAKKNAKNEEKILSAAARIRTSEQQNKDALDLSATQLLKEKYVVS